MCTVPNGFIVVDNKGIHKFNDSIECVGYKGWVGLPKSKAISFPYLVVYHHLKESLFVTRELDVGKQRGQLCEYSILDLKLIQTTYLPEPAIAPSLVTVLNDGRMVCARVADDRGFLWVKNSADFEDTWKNSLEQSLINKFEIL